MLRVQADAVGRKAKCPHCGAVSEIPAASTGAASPPTAADPVGSYGATATASAAASPAPPTAAGNPVAASVSPSSPVSPASPVAPAPTAYQPTAAAGGASTPMRQQFDRIRQEIAKIYVGQEELVLGALVALFSNGHVLIESVPGLGKTLLVRALGKVLGCKFGRIQFTADLMPSDITGAPIFNMKTQEFHFRPGPVFTQLLLADEINRSPAKTHAALLEIMQEYRVTVENETHKLERPFLVMATQNPIESEGTYNLPEAQLDRFMFKIIADYPSEAEEADILRQHGAQRDVNDRLENELETVTSPAEIVEWIDQCGQIRVDDRLLDYINKLVRLTRNWPQIHMGASPRAGLALIQGARTLAAFRGRDYAVPDDVVELVKPALRHRVILTAEADVEGRQVDEVLGELLHSVEVPRL
ncbi:MAG: MoxR family ATPase [Planctomycetes bacterium]|nr:MoxR family ATPase [Planctomycetota bacterium]